MAPKISTDLNASLRGVVEDILRSQATRERYGFYRGIVTDIDDPLKLGRVRVHVFAIHGDPKFTPVNHLPWATVAEPQGGGYDYGSFTPPPIGSGVLVLFEQGIQEHPVVFGTFRGIPVRNELNPNVFLSRGDHQDEKSWLPPDGANETPQDVFTDKSAGDAHPTRSVPFKSVKGHSISSEDGDGKEHFRVSDRAGQTLEMYSPVSSDAQHGGDCSAGNEAQRGARTSLRGDSLPQDAMRDKKGHIRLKDLSGQEIFMDARHQNERIRISSQDELRTSSQSIELRSGRGKEGITIKDKTGSSVALDPNGPESVSLADTKGNKIALKPGDSVQIQSARNLDVNVTGSSKEYVGGNSNKTVVGTDQLKVLGNCKRNVVNDLTLGVLGNTSVSLGAALQLLIANAPTVSGSSASTPLEVTVKVGDITIRTEGQLVGGDILLSADNGEARLDGTEIKLGGGGANEPLVLGEQWKSIMGELLTAIEAITVPTALGPSGIPLNAAQFEAVRTKIQANLHLSDFVFTEKSRS